MEHRLTGRWKLVSSENFEEFLAAVGCPDEIRPRSLSVMNSTSCAEDGTVGLVTELAIYSQHQAIRLRIFRDGTELIREFMVPFDVEVPLIGMNDRVTRITFKMPDSSRVTMTEKDDSYSMHGSMETADGSNMTLTYNCQHVTCVRKFVKIP